MPKVFQVKSSKKNLPYRPGHLDVGFYTDVGWGVVSMTETAKIKDMTTSSERAVKCQLKHKCPCFFFFW